MKLLLPEPHGPGSYMTWLASQPCLCCQRLGITELRVILHHLHVWGLPRRTNNPLRSRNVNVMFVIDTTSCREYHGHMAENTFNTV